MRCKVELSYNIYDIAHHPLSSFIIYENRNELMTTLFNSTEDVKHRNKSLINYYSNLTIHLIHFLVSD